jgi:hypothetical protein
MTRSLPLFACFVLGAAMPVAAQKIITLNPVTVAGELVQAGPRGVVVKGGDGKNWTVQLDNNTKVKITGTAVPEVLTPRVAVRFVASIDKKTGKAQDKIDKITIFTPSQNIASRTLGVELAKAGADKDENAGMGGPMIIPNMRPNPAPGPGQEKPVDAGPAPDVIPGTGADAPAAGKPKRGGGSTARAGKNAAASVPEVASYEVCAQIVSYHNHRLIVSPPNRYFKQKITVELTPEAEIALDLSDLNTAKPGDQVSAKGYYITPGICQHTDSVVITLANPLGEKAGRHKARPAAKAGDAPAATPRRPAAGKAKPEPAAPGDQNDPFPDAKPDEKPAGGEADKPVVNKERPKDDADPVMDDPGAKPAPQPKPDEAKPEEQKPDGAAKKPVPKNDEKDVFDK